MASLMIPGPQGKIEASFYSPVISSEARRSSCHVVLMSGPHPVQEEGLMHHPVMYALHRAFARAGFDILRFNYRGSGHSSGTFTNGEGEIADAEACLNWLSDRSPLKTIYWVAGYSFGAWIAMQILMRRFECARFVCVGSRTNLYPYDFLAPCPAPGLMVHGKNDLVTPYDVMVRLVHHLSLQKKGHKIDLKLLADADAQFKGCLPELEEKVTEYILREVEILDQAAAAAHSGKRF
jgi:alpha/beta superfamily hydrolase